MMRIILLLTVVCCISAGTLHAQLPPAYSARLQTVLDSMCEKWHIKGASAAVLVPGKGTWKGAHGLAEAGQPMTTGMALPLNSNTKTYIAALMLKLQEDGLLQITDTIGKWIRGKQHINGQITIQQMLNHTSGLFNYTESAAFADSLEADFSRVWHPEEMLQFVEPPLFAPGATWSYCNTNYLLAGMIIAQVTGMPVEQAVRTKLLTPHGLNNTWFYPQEMPTAAVPHFWFNAGGAMIDGNLAFGYTPEAFYSAASAAGAMFSTAEDNMTFWSKLISGQIINNASLAQWRETVTLSAGTGYGLGVFRFKNFNGHLVYEHGGTGAGALNENLADSVTGVCISVMTNQDSASNNILLSQVVRALHSVTLNPPTTAVAAVVPSADFSLFPNPAHHELQLVMQTPMEGRYSVTDVTGRAVLGGLLNGRKTILPVHSLQNGVYNLQISGTQGEAGVRTFCILR